MARYLAIAALFLAAGAAIWWIWRPAGGAVAGLHLSGDGASAVAAALPDRLPRAPTAGTAAVEAVLLSDWTKTRYVPGAAARCGEACGGATALVRVIALRPSGSRKTVYLNRDAFAATTPGAADCLARALVAEWQRLRPAAPIRCDVPTPGEVPAVTLWQLPFGLGKLGGR